MRFFDAGMQPFGVIAIGQLPTGVIAIGQGASGVIAIGQLSRGVIAVGQLALGVIAFGQVAVGGWAGGMLSASAVEGPSLIGYGAFGKLGLRDLLHLRLGAFQPRSLRGRPWMLTLSIVVTVLATALVWFVAIEPVFHDLTKDRPVEQQQPPPLR